MPTTINVVPVSVVHSPRSHTEATGNFTHGFLLARDPKEDHGAAVLTLYGVDSQGVPVDLRSQATLEVVQHNSKVLEIQASGPMLNIKVGHPITPTPLVPIPAPAAVPAPVPTAKKEDKPTLQQKDKEALPPTKPEEGLLQQTAQALAETMGGEEPAEKRMREPAKDTTSTSEYGLKELAQSGLVLAEQVVPSGAPTFPSEVSNTVVVFTAQCGNRGQFLFSLPVTTYTDGSLSLGQPRCNN